MVAQNQCENNPYKVTTVSLGILRCVHIIKEKEYFCVVGLVIRRIGLGGVRMCGVAFSSSSCTLRHQFLFIEMLIIRICPPRNLLVFLSLKVSFDH